MLSVAPDSDENDVGSGPVPFKSKIHQAARSTYFNTKQISMQSVLQSQQEQFDGLDELLMSSSSSSGDSSGDDLDL